MYSFPVEYTSRIKYRKEIIQLCVSATPTKIMSPTVRILNKRNDTSDRQFPVATAITLSCQGEVGSDPNSVSI